MNSELLYKESGFVTADSLRACTNGVLTRFNLPPSSIEAAQIFLLARKRSKSAPPLYIELNGLSCSFDVDRQQAVWLSCDMDSQSLQTKTLTITLPPQEGWDLVYDAANGEPVIRLRIAHEGAKEVLRFPAYGDAKVVVKAEAWLAMLPPTLRHPPGDRWQWCWDLAGFLAAAWPYSNAKDASSYAPWDARTILKWGRDGRDDKGDKPIVMCVHYAVCFVQFCTAMGIPARAVVSTSGLDEANGHFFAEVWLEEFAAWAMLDPNLHLCYRDTATNRPLSTAELAGLQGELASMAQFGEGFKSQEGRLGGFARAECLSGNVYKFWGVWARHDWIAHATSIPPAHGVLAYSETDIIWCSPEETTQSRSTRDQAAKDALAMFPFHLSSRWLALPPAAGVDADVICSGGEEDI